MSNKGFCTIAGSWPGTPISRFSKEEHKHRWDDRTQFDTYTTEQQHFPAFNEKYYQYRYFPDQESHVFSISEEEHEHPLNERTKPPGYSYTGEPQHCSASNDINATAQSSALETARANIMPPFGQYQSAIPYRFYLGGPEPSNIPQYQREVRVNQQHQDHWNFSEEEHEHPLNERTKPTGYSYTGEPQRCSASNDIQATAQSSALETARTNTVPPFGQYQSAIPYRFYVGGPEPSNIPQYQREVRINQQHQDHWNSTERSHQHSSSHGHILSFVDLCGPHRHDLDCQVDWVPDNLANPASMATGHGHASSCRGLLKLDTFPPKLMHALLSNPRRDAFVWLQEGNSFSVVNRDLFVSKVLTKVFRETKYTSFVRRLRRWGFTRLPAAFGQDCFHHSLFDSNFPERTSLISCTSYRPSASQQGEMTLCEREQ